MALVMVATAACSKKDDGDDATVTEEYVDLGLTSGTKWKNVNEKNSADTEHGFYDYNTALNTFGTKMPNKDQWIELDDECTWTWNGSGYRVVGPNGKSISLPALGFRDCNGNVATVGTYGYYWSFTYSGANGAWFLGFNENGTEVNTCDRCAGYAVRLVQK